MLHNFAVSHLSVRGLAVSQVSVQRGRGIRGSDADLSLTIIRPCLERPPRRGVSSLVICDGGYQEGCPADQRGQQAGPSKHGVLEL